MRSRADGAGVGVINGVSCGSTSGVAKRWGRCDDFTKVLERRNAEIVSCLDAQEVQQLSGLLDRLVEHARAAAGAGDEPTE